MSAAQPAAPVLRPLPPIGLVILAALAIAEHCNAEIISVDSATVYRDMDAGTAKPTPAELARVPHHLINLIDPTDAYSAARFRADALACIGQIHARGRRALLAGGTMLYFKALLAGLDTLPAADPQVRADLDAEAARAGWPALHAQLQQVDPVTAARLAPNDSQRIQRALEVFRVSGQPLSALHQRDQVVATPVHPWRVLALPPSDRTVLHARIAERFDQMLQAGLVDEVRALRLRYPDLHRDLPAMRCVGYRQAWEWLEGEVDAPALRDRGIAATRQLAKRQRTWMRALPADIELDCLRPDLQQAGCAAARQLFGLNPASGGHPPLPLPPPAR